jgi:hypothetical protein
MKKARERILTTADGEVGWLLKFIQTDLDTLTASEWMVLAFEIASFVDDVANRRGAEIATEAGWSVRSIPGEGFRGTFPVVGRPKRSRRWSWAALRSSGTPPSPPLRSRNSRSL